MKIRQFVAAALALFALCGSVLAHADEPAPYVDEEAVREAIINQLIASTCKEMTSEVLWGEREHKANLIGREYTLQLRKFRSELGLSPISSSLTDDEYASLAQTESQIEESCTDFMQDVLNQMRTEETRSKLQSLMKQMKAEDRSSL